MVRTASTIAWYPLPERRSGRPQATRELVPAARGIFILRRQTEREGKGQPSRLWFIPANKRRFLVAPRCPNGNTVNSPAVRGETYGKESTSIVTALEGPDNSLEGVVEF